jgi:glyoxylase-like metal-dependent hydrolase (beta-lactamase superfamily II)
VFVTQTGVVLVDTKLANNGEAILAQIRKVSGRRISMIINSHSHPDHIGSNDYFPVTVEKVTHENTKKWMEANPRVASNQAVMPTKTFADKMTLGSGRDQIDLYYFGAGHTDGDAFIVFRDARVMHSGDIFGAKGLPFLDVGNGGSGVAIGDTLMKAANGIRNVDRVITGHTDTVPWQDFLDYGEFNRLFLEHARASLKAGKTPEQAMADLRLPEKFKGYTLTGGRGGPGGNFNVIYEELKRAGTR